MFAIIRRLATTSISNPRSYASFAVRDILREYVEDTGTLLNRFSKHIAMERYKCEEHVLPAITIRYSDFFPITDERYFRRTVQKTPATQLPALIIHASTYKSNAAPPMYATTLNALDAQSTALLAEMDTSTVLETLYAFLFLMPNWLRRIDFYHAAMRRLANENCKSKERFLQICFYMSFYKQQKGSYLETFLATHLEQHLSKLTPMDLALLSYAVYKTSTVIRGVAREHYVKAMRLQRVHNEKICKQLQLICLDPAQLAQLQPRGLAHIFAYFAETQWDQPDCMQALVARLLKYKPSELRAKDLATFIWSCAQLNCTLSASELKQLEIWALRKLDQGEYDRFADQLVDTSLSLCMLGQYSKQLFDGAEELKAQQQLPQRAQPKVDSRLIVLRTAVAIEQPSWTDIKREQVFKELGRAPAYLLNQREDLTAYSKQLTADAEVEGVDLVCPIVGINLPSLRVQTLGEQSVIYFVELLTTQQTLKFSKKPTSLLRFKQRLLQALGQRVVLLNSGEMVSNAQALQQLLEQTSVEKTETRAVI
ncbi:CG4619 [Drosophila busckii]|uniref:CG4619 n=1 Tax=Drosophila busckii TaxID=30019 RepID=A0A0M4EQK2_DROBS|nr:CG4619 [Drosophila busckii]